MSLTYEQDNFIKELYMEMYAPLLAYARSTLEDSSLAEEAVQDTFRIACAKVKDLSDSNNPNGWLVNTLKYVIKNMIRTRAQLSRHIIESLSPYHSELRGENDEVSYRLMYADIIESEEFRLVKRIALDKCSMLELAQDLGISVDACKKRVQRAKAKLREAIKEYL